MRNKPLFIIADIVLPVVFLLVTAGLFFLFMPSEAGKLFYTNLGVTLWAEIVFFGYLSVLKGNTKGFSVALLAFLGISAVYYIAGALLWMLLYSFTLSWLLSYKVYASVHAVMLLLWLVAGVLLARQDNDYQDKMEAQGRDYKAVEYFGQKMNYLLSRYQKLPHQELSNADNLEVLRNKIKGLPIAIMNTDIANSQLTDIIRRGEDCMMKLEQARTKDEATLADEDFRVYLLNALRDLEFLKNISRK